MPWINQIIQANQVVISGPGDGLFVYNGTPGANRLVMSEVAETTTDPYGNMAQAGFTWYSEDNPGEATNVSFGGQFISLTNSGGNNVQSGAWINNGHFFMTETGLFIIPGIITLTDAAGDLTAQPYIANDTGNPGNLIMGAPAGKVEIANSLSATAGTAAKPTLITTDTWHSLGALGGTSGYTVNQGRYMLTTDGFLEVDIVLTATATAATGTYSFANSLPAPPLNARSYPLGFNGAQTSGASFPSLRINGAGGVGVQIPALPTGTILSVTQRIPIN